MRFATFNIRHGLPPGRTDVDHRALAAAVTHLDADLVGLQEVDRGTPRVGGSDQAGLVARATGMTAHFGRAIRLGAGEYGNALLVRGEVLDVVELPMPAEGEDRMAILARVVDPTDSAPGHAATEWCVAVTHLQNQRRGRPDEAPDQLEVVLDALDRLASPGTPAVLLGDLNMGPDRVEPILVARGFRWAVGPPTFPSHRPRERIDWIAVRGAVVEAVIVPDVRVSDHRPLVAQVRVDPDRLDELPGRP